MLYLIAFFLSFGTFAARTNIAECMNRVLLTSGKSQTQIDAMLMTQGERSINKKFRQEMAVARLEDNKSKHTMIQGTPSEENINRARKLSMEGDKHAQYIPGVDRKLELHALNNMPGHYMTIEDAKKSTIYKFVKFEHTIGFDKGKETQWMRVEWSSGSVHGQPISEKRLREQCKDCF